MTTMTVDRLTAGAVQGGAARPGPHFLTAPFSGRTWREQGYLTLALLLFVGLQIAAFVVSLFGATAPMVASFAWILAASFISDGLLQLRIASCAKQAEDV